MEGSLKSLKNILIIATGGTIVGCGDIGKTGEYTIGDIDINSIVKNIPNISKLANIKEEQFSNIDSCNMTPLCWLKLAKRINELSKNDEIDGFVITHGTDTMDETAYFLNLTLKTHKPVVLTGSMRPSTATSADGPFNLYQAVALASSDKAIGKGVLIAFSDAIFCAGDIQKINTFRTDAFSGRDFGCVGYIKDNEVIFYYEPLRKHTLNSDFNVSGVSKLPPVSVVYFSAGESTAILEAAAKESKGIIIAGAGGGGYSDEWIGKVKDITGRGIPVVRSSRVGNGLVFPDSVWDIPSNTIPSYNIQPQKARILLSLALTITKDFNKIASLFPQY